MSYRFLKYVAYVLGAMLALFALLLVVIALTVDPNQYKPQIVKLVQEKKQRTLDIEGEIKLKLFPKLGVDLGKTRLSEHKGSKEFAVLDSVHLYVAWLPLLKKELVVDKVTLVGARVTLIRFPDGTTNIDDLLSKEESEQIKFDIDGVRVVKSAIQFDDRMTQRKLALSELNLESGRIRDKTHTDVDMDFKLTVDQPKVNTQVQMSSGVWFDLKQKHYVVDGLDLAVTGEAAGIKQLDLRAQGEVDIHAQKQEIGLKGFKLTTQGQRGADKLDLSVEVPALSLTEARAEGSKIGLRAHMVQPKGEWTATLNVPSLTGNGKQFQAPGLHLVLAGKQGESSIKGNLSGPLQGSLGARRIELSKLDATVDIANPNFPKGGAKLHLAGNTVADLSKDAVNANLKTKFDDSNIQAKLDVSRLASPLIQFDVAIDQLDVDRYLPPKSKEAKAEKESPIDLSGLKSLNASGSVRIGKLKVANIKSSNVRLDIKAGGGKLEVNPLSANLYEGSMQGAVSATTSAQPQFMVRQNLTGISVGPLLRDLAEKDVLEGRGNVSVNITTRGNTVVALKQGLDGSAAANLRDGAIKGIDIAGCIRSAKTKLGLSGGSETQSAATNQQTDFSELTASFNIRDGVAHNDDLSAKSPLLRLSGNGDINIGASSIDYLAKATVVGTLEGQGGREREDLRGVTVPVRVTGPLAAMKYRLDFGAMAKESAKAKVEQKKEEIQEKAKGKLEEKLKGLFGR